MGTSYEKTINTPSPNNNWHQFLCCFIPKKYQTSEINNKNMCTYLVVNLNQQKHPPFLRTSQQPPPRSVAPGQRSVGLCVLSSPSFTPQIFLKKDPYHLWNWYTYSAKGSWTKSLNFIFPMKYVIPKSLKVGHWLSQYIYLHDWLIFLGSISR